MLVVGATGGGKGGLIHLIAREALEAGWVLRIVDPKASGDYRWVAERGAPVAHDLEDQVEVLRRAATEVRSRCRVLWDHGLDRVGLLPANVGPPALAQRRGAGAAEVWLRWRVAAGKPIGPPLSGRTP